MINIEKIEKMLDAGEFTKARTALRAVKPGAGTGRLYFLRGEALRGLGLFGPALKEYASARSLARGDEALTLELWLNEARCSRALGNETETLAAAKKALALSKNINLLRAEARLEWALALRLTGRLDAAASLLERLLVDYKRRGDRSAAAFTLWALGGLYRLQGRYAEGIKAFEASLDYAKKADDKAAAGYALFGLGGILRVAGFMGRALDCYSRARKLFAATDDAFAKAYAECGTANVLRQLGRLEEAFAGYTRAHKLYSDLADWADLGFVEWGMGELQKKAGHFAQAQAHYSRAEKLFKGRCEPRGEALTMLSLAALDYLRGQTARAERRYAAALGFIRKNKLHTHLETFT